MDKNLIISKTKDFVRYELSDSEGGHDWWHTYRVWKNAKNIAKTEEGDLFIIELGALLHDIADYKFHDESVGPKKAREFLESLEVDDDIIEEIENIIRNISFKGGGVKQDYKSQELDIIQDADRLDAIGAIGIARTFNYGGYKQRPIYDPDVDPNIGMNKDEYIKRESPTINHFYEKLLLLKDRMNTKTAQKMAQRRHDFMENFLQEFYKEWEGES